MPFVLAGVALAFTERLLANASVRIRRPKIGELAHQAQGARIFAKGEYPALTRYGAESLMKPPREKDDGRLFRAEEFVVFCLL